MVTKRKFEEIIKLASRPIKQDLKKSERKKDDYCNGKQTRQHKTVDTLEKRNGKYH